ncbi:MAG: hypothetical protein C0501_07055 [Isosphaera sp.]|nr:hypothetical protein [Isosphaera sp.]
MPVRIEAHAEPIPGYTLLDRLGAGGFGEVWRAEAPGGIFKAIKIIHGDLRSRDNDLVRYAEQELKSLKRVKQVRHPYLLALDRYDIVEGRLLITMELADCNLWDRFRACRDRGLPGIPRDELLGYMAEVAEVLDLFDDRFQLQHLDIKPQNLFLLHSHVKVADFGQVKDLEGLIAEVTGGITPVYAAPETFDGLVTRYCDQYSLACVYQELLTGVRPFDGGSMSQLLMQHLNLPPNLGPSPPGDRPALARALAKKPEDRWPNVTTFVRALAGGGHPGRAAAVSDTPTMFATDPVERPADPVPLVVPAEATTDTPPPRAVTETTGPVFTPAPPEVTGPGPLRPALVLGLGRAGLRVLQRLRFDLAERYGPPDATPAVRLLYVDTDPDDLADAARPRPADRLAGLGPDEVFAAQLNRAAHYHKPRANGRPLTDGWFDPQLLYKLQRVPRTMGVRLFGRLAFCDHYRTLMGKVEVELAAALSDESLARTEARTGLERRTNRPRVYVVAGLGGGTGGGAFLDAAYAVRTRLRRLGYEHPDVVGVLVVPPADPAVTAPQALGNTYAALTELNHYSRADTVFAAGYDDRNGAVRDKAPPFARCYLVPGPAVVPGAPSGSGSVPAFPARPGSGAVVKPSSRILPPAAPRPVPAAPADFRPYADAAELVRLNLFTPVGRAADEHRPAAEEGPAVTLSAFGLAGFGWPRGEVVTGAAAAVARVVLKGWAAPDPRRARDVVPGMTRQRWAELGLDPGAVLARLRSAADAAAGGSVEGEIARTADPLAPGRGWLARLPDPARVAAALDRLAEVLGPPASSAKRPPTAVEAAVGEEAAVAAAGFALDLRTLVPVLVDDPEFRLAGAEEVLRQCLATTDRLMEAEFRAAAEADAAAQAGFECASRCAHGEKGVRRPPAGEFAEAVRAFPRARLRAVLGRAVFAVYQAVRDALTGQLADVAAARARLAAAADLRRLRAEEGEVGGRLLPPGCGSVGEAVEKFLGVLGDHDLAEVDRRAQAAVAGAAEGLFQACLNPAGGAEAVAAAVCEEARAHLDRRLGAVDFAAMFAGKYPTPRQAERAVEQAYLGAEPGWVGGGPWSADEVAVLGCPGEGPLRDLAVGAVPVKDLPVADTPDELAVYREWPAVPLAALPQLGPAAAAAYRALPEAQQCPAHARLDVTVWRDVDEG